MCIIIEREPGVVIPEEDFTTAVENNKDGWGLSVPNGNGKLLVRKSLETDTESLYKYLHDDLKDEKLLLHLRHTTAGDTILRNAHPFPVLEHSVDGTDLRMAHNGTIHKYKHAINSPKKWESDTRNFVGAVVRPLFKRLSKGHTTEEMLNDPFLIKLLEDMVPSVSVLSFIDGSGNSLHINPTGNGGEFREGWYVSNKYSFDKDHRKPKQYSFQGQSKYTTNGWDDYIEKQKSKVVSLKDSVKPKTKNKEAFGEEMTIQKFTTRYGMDEDELRFMGDDGIDCLMEHAPDDVVLLVKELLFILENRERELATCSKKLKEKTK